MAPQDAGAPPGETARAVRRHTVAGMDARGPAPTRSANPLARAHWLGFDLSTLGSLWPTPRLVRRPGEPLGTRRGGHLAGVPGARAIAGWRAAYPPSLARSPGRGRRPGAHRPGVTNSTPPERQRPSCGPVDPTLPEATVADLAAGGITVGMHAAAPGQWCLLGATGRVASSSARSLRSSTAPARLALDDAALRGRRDAAAAVTPRPGPGMSPTCLTGRYSRHLELSPPRPPRSVTASAPPAACAPTRRRRWTNSRAVMAAGSAARRVPLGHDSSRPAAAAVLFPPVCRRWPLSRPRRGPPRPPDPFEDHSLYAACHHRRPVASASRRRAAASPHHVITSNTPRVSSPALNAGGASVIQDQRERREVVPGLPGCGRRCGPSRSRARAGVDVFGPPRPRRGRHAVARDAAAGLSVMFDARISTMRRERRAATAPRPSGSRQRRCSSRPARQGRRQDGAQRARRTDPAEAPRNSSRPPASTRSPSPSVKFVHAMVERTAAPTSTSLPRSSPLPVPCPASVFRASPMTTSARPSMPVATKVNIGIILTSRSPARPGRPRR